MKNGNLVIIRKSEPGQDETVLQIGGEEITLKISVRGNTVKQCWHAPEHVKIYRREMLDPIEADAARPAMEAALKRPAANNRT